MNNPPRVLLLVGSPRRAHSTSQSLGGYLQKKMEQAGARGRTFHLNPVVLTEAGGRELQAEVADTDIIILATPLYVDSLPAPVIKAMGIMASRKKATTIPTATAPAPAPTAIATATNAAAASAVAPDALAPTALPTASAVRFCAIMNCGFPEYAHNLTGLEICRCFARAAGMEWAGGLAMGMGGFIDGKPLEKLGGMAGKITRALDLAAAALLEGRAIPEQAVQLMAQPVIPHWLYRAIANRAFRAMAKKNNVQEQLNARPYD